MTPALIQDIHSRFQKGVVVHRPLDLALIFRLFLFRRLTRFLCHLARILRPRKSVFLSLRPQNIENYFKQIETTQL